MGQKLINICDQCGSESKRSDEHYIWGWSYVGFLPKTKGVTDQRWLCPKCSVLLKKFLKGAK